VRALKHVADDTVIVAMEINEKFPDGSIMQIDGIDYEVIEMIPPDNGIQGLEPVFAVKYKKTKIADGSNSGKNGGGKWQQGNRPVVQGPGKSGAGHKGPKR
jgi:hypothetical protein